MPWCACSMGKRLWSFVYNSSRLNGIDSFASRADISVMVTNMQAFNAFDESKSKEGRGGDKAARCDVPTLDDAYDPAYLRYLHESPEHKVHEGHFSIDKKGRSVDSKLKRGSEFAEGEDAVAACDLIPKDKERLFSFKEPVRFIFSHSALREGWDNPNVFQICTLKGSGDSEIGKRQEVGRGLRLCVNSHSTRQDELALGRDGVHRVNLLTVIASEGYDSFVKSLQSETTDELCNKVMR